MKHSPDRTVTLTTLCEVVCAMHLANYVEAPIKDRGGLMIVAPPGALKTTSLLLLPRHYSTVMPYSNLNTQTLTRLREDLAAGTVRSIVLPDVQAIYAGDPRTVGRLEQVLMQIVSEGHLGAAWEDTAYRKFKSRATLFGAMPSPFFERRAPDWREMGFLRRFLWCFYRLANPDALTDAIVKWERARPNGALVVPQLPADGEIQMKATEAERRELHKLLSFQPRPNEIQLLLLIRTFSALRWHYQRLGAKKDPMCTLREFARTLGNEDNESAELVLS